MFQTFKSFNTFKLFFERLSLGWLELLEPAARSIIYMDSLLRKFKSFKSIPEIFNRLNVLNILNGLNPRLACALCG